ncbi:MAG: radical SAM protein [Deltaproteobacteria bacterium]|jgi:ribosomal protein S12 methylthiotransferase|nr:radical SAM protein [Deltaproteobacteria bacterium]
MAGSQGKGLKVHLVSLGCAKNLVDSERLLGEAARILSAGVCAVPEEADLVMLNTCAFIRAAQEEAVAAVFDLKSRMKPGARLAVLGCLPRLADGRLELPEADLVVPVGSYAEFPEMVGRLFGPGGDAGGGMDGAPGRGAAVSLDGAPDGVLKGVGPGGVRLVSPPPFESWERAPEGTPRFRSYLKIAEGCDRRCSYCLIPSIRGPLAPVPLAALMDEAEALAAAGVLELTLVAQDLTAWRDGTHDLGDLCRELSGIAGLRWIRLMYLHPDGLGGRALERLKAAPKVVPYLDVPFQHASARMLGAMGRGRADPMDVVREVREIWPEAALRTTLMTGFPGETEEDFRIMLDFIDEARLDHVGFFKFSREEGTPAARLADAVPRGVAERRRRTLAAAQRKVSRAANRARVGRILEVLVEGPSDDAPEVSCGRGTFQAPEADGLVYFDGEQPQAGSVVRARIVRAGDYDLVASLAEPEAGDRDAGKSRGSGARGTDTVRDASLARDADTVGDTSPARDTNAARAAAVRAAAAHDACARDTGGRTFIARAVGTRDVGPLNAGARTVPGDLDGRQGRPAGGR